MSADRLHEIKARAEQVHWTSTSIEQATARMASSAADVPWLLAEVEEYDATLTRQGDLLTRTVNALRGNPPPLTSWSHHDIPELAAEKVSEVQRLTAERDALAAQVARVESLAERFDSVLAEHLSQDDCQCEMKDCYECGPWHACIHNGPPGRARQIRAALAGAP